MTPEDFVTRLYTDVMSAARDEISFFANPPGRAPAADLREAGDFIAGLRDDQREALGRLLELVSARTLMKVLYSLDGVHPILENPGVDRFDLSIVTAQGRDELLPRSGPGELGDIARALETERRGI